jgi:hypothetical protein
VGQFHTHLTHVDLSPNTGQDLDMQRKILWGLSGLVSALLLANLLLGLMTRGAISRIQSVQAQVANGSQMETVLRNLSIRLAMAGEKDPAFQEILKKHELNVKLDSKTDRKSNP